VGRCSTNDIQNERCSPNSNFFATFTLATAQFNTYSITYYLKYHEHDTTPVPTWLGPLADCSAYDHHANPQHLQSLRFHCRVSDLERGCSSAHWLVSVVYTLSIQRGRCSARTMNGARYIHLLLVTTCIDGLGHSAFLLVLINGYDLLGALQDNWTVYWYSLMSRGVAMAFFWTLGEPWNQLVGFEGATFAILGVAMWFGRSIYSEGK